MAEYLALSEMTKQVQNRANISKMSVDTTGIAIIEDRITTVKTRMLASRESLVQGEQLLLRWDVEEDEPIPENALEAIYDQAIASMKDANCVILSDYGQGVVYDSGAEKVLSRQKHNIPIVLQTQS